MYMTGFADEASGNIDLQIKTTRLLGWKNIEMRTVYGSNIAFMSDAEFEELASKLADSSIKINCFGSGIGNWAKFITESPDSSYDELQKALPRLEKLGTKLIRMMSFAIPEEERADAWKYEDEVVKRVTRIVETAAAHGITCLHENCKNWGGLSYKHTLRLMERIKSPYFKLVFDTGNPVVSVDYGKSSCDTMQSSWEFYSQVKEFVAYVHVKDALFENGKEVFTYPGEGAGDVRRILTDLFRNGYDGGISIEPHMGKVFHDTDVYTTEEYCMNNYVEYGKRLEKMISEIKAEL